MKLLFCPACCDVRAVRIETWTRCRCRRPRARNVGQRLAKVSGDGAMLLGIRKDSLTALVRREMADRQAEVDRALGHELVAFVIPWSSPHVLARETASRRSAQ
jgi:hypothetical protein